jgi:hypothetical protein
MRVTTLIRSLGLATLVVASSAHAIPLGFSGSFDTQEDVDGLAFDPSTGNLFITDRTSIIEYRTDGTRIGSISASVGSIRGIDILPSGNFLVTSDTSGNERVVELDTSGALVPGGIDIDVSAIVNDNNGVVFDAVTSNIFAADEDDDVVRQFSTAGTLQKTIDTDDIGVGDTEGITINPLNGNLLIGDDLGLNSTDLFEITRNGNLVSSTDLSGLTGFGSNDLLGLSVGSGRLFAGQGNEQRVDGFTIDSTVPEPGTLVLLSFGLAALGYRERKGSNVSEA